MPLVIAFVANVIDSVLALVALFASSSIARKSAIVPSLLTFTSQGVPFKIAIPSRVPSADFLMSDKELTTSPFALTSSPFFSFSPSKDVPSISKDPFPLSAISIVAAWISCEYPTSVPDASL